MLNDLDARCFNAVDRASRLTCCSAIHGATAVATAAATASAASLASITVPNAERRDAVLINLTVVIHCFASFFNMFILRIIYPNHRKIA